MEPKYAPVKGSLGPENRCWTYAVGPITAANDARNSADPRVHLFVGVGVCQSHSPKAMRIMKESHAEGQGQGKTSTLVPCRSPSPVTRHGKVHPGSVMPRCEIDSSCMTGMQEMLSLFSSRTYGHESEKEVGRGRPRGSVVYTTGYILAWAWEEKRSKIAAVALAITTSLPFQINTVKNTTTYRITNFLGLSDSTGNRKKQITKQARAPRLQAANTSMRSHLLTMIEKTC